MLSHCLLVIKMLISVALSTTVAEFIATIEACMKFLWMKSYLEEHGFNKDKNVLLCDI